MLRGGRDAKLRKCCKRRKLCYTEEVMLQRGSDANWYIPTEPMLNTTRLITYYHINHNVLITKAVDFK